MILKVGFQHPDLGVPCIGTYDEEEETLIFDLEDYERDSKHVSLEHIEKVREWCIQNAINCYSKNQAERHLEYLGIKEGLGEW